MHLHADGLVYVTTHDKGGRPQAWLLDKCRGVEGERIVPGKGEGEVRHKGGWMDRERKIAQSSNQGKKIVRSILKGGAQKLKEATGFLRVRGPVRR